MNSLPLAIALAGVVFACTGARADEQARMGEIILGTQMAGATEGADRRDHLVAAAYAARRIVEDAPNSALAAQLQGAGIAVLGGQPLTYAGLQEQMIAVCMEAPDALCLADWSYVLTVPEVTENEAMIMEFRTGDPDIQIGTSGDMYYFHADAAIIYARLGETDRVRETIAHHIRHVSPISLVERGAQLPRMALALWIVGEREAAAQLLSDFVEAVQAAPEWEQQAADFYIAQAETASLVLSAVAGEISAEMAVRRIEFQGMRAFMAQLVSFHYDYPSEALVDLAEETFWLCLQENRITSRSCASSKVLIAARTGGADDVTAIIEAATREGGRVAIGEAVYALGERGLGDEAAALYDAFPPENPTPNMLITIGAAGRPDFLARAEDVAAAIPGGQGQDAVLSAIAHAYSVLGEDEEAARVFATIPDPTTQETAQRVTALLAPVDRAILDRDLATAVSGLPELDPSLLEEYVSRLAWYALDW